MAKNDLALPKDHSYGPFVYQRDWALTASETFAVGEPVYVTSSGRVKESGTLPTAAKFWGIAASSGDTVGASDTVGTFRRKLGQFVPGASPNLPTTADQVSVLVTLPGALIECGNICSDGTGAASITPTEANIGDLIRLVLSGGGVYFFDFGSPGTATAATILVCHDVLDVNGDSITFSGRTGVRVQAKVLTSGAMFDGTAVLPPVA